MTNCFGCGRFVRKGSYIIATKDFCWVCAKEKKKIVYHDLETIGRLFKILLMFKKEMNEGPPIIRCHICGSRATRGGVFQGELFCVPCVKLKTRFIPKTIKPEEIKNKVDKLLKILELLKTDDSL